MSPVLVSAAFTIGLFAVILLLLRPGYWINDDLKIAWLLGGYPGDAGPSPFPVHSNVLVGLLLIPFFVIAGTWNWFSIFLTLTNALSIFGLLYVSTCMTRLRLPRLLGWFTVVLASALLILEISYTVSAFLASLAGICLVWTSAQHDAPSHREAMAGIALVVLGSLIRLQMLAVAVVIAVPPLILAGTRTRRFAVLLTAAGLCALGAYGLGRLYVRTRPDWNAFFAYTQVRQTIHDSHRLFNVHGQIRRVGWTPNDQELFARWFFPDADLYSYDHLQYLEQHVSPYSQDLGTTLTAWLPGIMGGRNTPYVALIIGAVIFSGGAGLKVRKYLALVVALLMVLALNAGFAIAYKNPDYVQAASLAGCLIVSALVLCAEFDRRLGQWPIS